MNISLEIKFKNRPKVTRITIPNDGEAHMYRLQVDDKKTFEFGVKVGDHIPLEDKSDGEKLDEEDAKTTYEQPPLDRKSSEENDRETWLRRFRSSGFPKVTIGYLSSEIATEEDKEKNRADWRYHSDLVDQIKTALEGPKGARKDHKELIEGPEEPLPNNLVTSAMEVRILFKKLQQLQAIKYRNLRRTKAYSYYLIQGEAPTLLDGIPGSPTVRILGRGPMAPHEPRVAKPVTTYDADIRKYRLFKEAWTGQDHVYGVYAVAFSPDGKRIASASEDHTIRIWKASNGKATHTRLLQRDILPLSMAFSPDEKKLVIADGAGPVWVWDAGEGDNVYKITEHINAAFEVAYSPDGNLIASAGWDDIVRVVNVRDNPNGLAGTVLYELKGRSVAFSSDGKQIVSGSRDKTVRLWDLATGEQVGELKGHRDKVNSVAFSPDGKQIVSGTVGGQVLVWDSATGEQVGELKGHSCRVYSVAFSPDGAEIVSGGDDATVRIWDSATGEQLQELTGPVDAAYSVAFSPDGSKIVSGGEDRVVRVWRRN